MINKRLLELNIESKKYIFLTVLMNWISIVCNILIVLFIGRVVDKVFRNDFNINILYTAIYIISLLLIRFICNYYSTRFSFYSSSKVRKSLREKIYNKLLDIGVGYNDKISTSSVVQIAVDGIEALEIYFGRYLPQLFYSLLAPITLFIVVSFISFKSAIVLLLCVPLIPVSIVAVMKIAKKLLSKYWNIYTNLGDSFLENLQGLTTLKIFDLDEEKNIEMNEEAENFRSITMKVLSMQLNSITIMDLIAFGGAAIGIIIALFEFKAGNISLGGAIIIILLSSEFFIPLRLLGSFFHVAMNGMAASDKIFDLLDTQVDKVEELSKDEISLLKDINIQINGVTFSYDKTRNALNNINVDVKNKNMIALVGESGCGKSTITSLLLKMQNVDEGEITLNGINIDNIPFKYIREKIGFMNHGSYIFNSTIEENILMGKYDATESEIYEALKKANMYDFVMSLPNKLKTKVGEEGSLLSGGQRQRLALARTIIKSPEIYIFDEATSNIDVESEQKIWESIYKIAKEKTVIVISHRLSNVRGADCIYVLDKGNLVESGTHQQLIELDSKYNELLSNQNRLESIYNEEMSMDVNEEVAVSE